jgi:hypothetical protein
LSRVAPRPGRHLGARELSHILLLILLAIPFLIPIPESLRRNLLTGTLGNLVHIPLFVIIMLLLHQRGPTAGRLLLTALLAAAVGGAIEGAQDLVGRSARYQDWLLDLHGIALASAWVLWRRRHRPLRLALLILLFLGVPARLALLPAGLAARKEARQRFPLLADFEQAHPYRLWSEVHDGRLAIVPEPDGSGHLLRLAVHSDDPYPGAHLVGFPPDWRDYRQLRWRARLAAAGPESTLFAVRLEDWHGYREGIWASRVFTARPAWREYSAPLREFSPRPDGARPLELSDVSALVFHLVRPDSSAVLLLDDVRLTDGSGEPADGRATGDVNRRATSP